jgi:hypothetical protein
MSSISPVKRTRRRTAIIATLTVALSLAFLNLDGYQNELVGRGDFFGEPPTVNWVHGWPCGFLGRQSIYPLSGIYSSPGSFSGPEGFYSRWPFGSAPVIAFWLGPLVIDCTFFAFVVAGTAYATQKGTFSLRVLFLAVSFLAVVCGTAISTSSRDAIQRALGSPGLLSIRYGPQMAAIFMVAIGTALTVNSAIYLISHLFRRWRPQSVQHA